MYSSQAAWERRQIFPESPFALLHITLAPPPQNTHTSTATGMRRILAFLHISLFPSSPPYPPLLPLSF